LGQSFCVGNCSPGEHAPAAFYDFEVDDLTCNWLIITVPDAGNKRLRQFFPYCIGLLLP
jgi:hypothetical protein